MRRRFLHSPPSADRWIISYADFVTLLFAFFVVMYAVGRNGHSRPGDVSASIMRAFGGSPPAVPASVPRAAASYPPTLPPPIRAAEDWQGPAVPAVAELAPSYDSLRRELRQEIADGKMDLTMDARGIVIALREGAFFPSGQDEIYSSASETMGKIAAVIAKLPNVVRLEGHTDSVPIHNARFHSNWVLSAARSISVLSLLESRWGIPSSRFAIAGYADNQPAGDNDTDEGRAKNRRVEIVIMGNSAPNR